MEEESDGLAPSKSLQLSERFLRPRPSSETQFEQYGEVRRVRERERGRKELNGSIGKRGSTKSSKPSERETQFQSKHPWILIA